MPSNQSSRSRRQRLLRAQLYLVCDSTPASGVLENVLHRAIAGGVEMVQLRDKRLDEEQLLVAARRAKRICARLGVLLIVNDHPAVALQAQADGVHVGQQDMPVQAVRELVGPEMLIGLSTHSPQQIDAAVAAPAGGPDYIGVGPVFRTPTKPGRPSVGTQLVRYAASAGRLPFFAIGGIDYSNIGEVIAAGAERVALVRAIAEATDPEQAAHRLSQALRTHWQEDAIA